MAAISGQNMSLVNVTNKYSIIYSVVLIGELVH